MEQKRTNARKMCWGSWWKVPVMLLPVMKHELDARSKFTWAVASDDASLAVSHRSFLVESGWAMRWCNSALNASWWRKDPKNVCTRNWLNFALVNLYINSSSIASLKSFCSSGAQKFINIAIFVLADWILSSLLPSTVAWCLHAGDC